MSEVFVIVPFYNEDLEVLKTSVSGLLNHFENIVLINDGGPEQMITKLDQFPVYYLRHAINLGQGAALQTGMEFALENGATIIVHFDADGQHDPQDAVLMVEQLKNENLDVVLGSRFLKKEHSAMVPLIRRILIKTGIFINFIFTGLWMTDAHHGLRVVHKRMAENICFRENKQLHATEILSIIKNNKFSYKEHPAKVSYTTYSIKKGQNNLQFVNILKDLIISRFIK